MAGGASAMNQPNRVEAWIPDDDEKPLVSISGPQEVVLIIQSEDRRGCQDPQCSYVHAAQTGSHTGKHDQIVSSAFAPGRLQADKQTTPLRPLSLIRRLQSPPSPRE